MCWGGGSQNASVDGRGARPPPLMALGAGRSGVYSAVCGATFRISGGLCRYFHMPRKLAKAALSNGHRQSGQLAEGSGSGVPPSSR